MPPCKFRPVEVQVFGTRKSADTRKALRFFAERRVKTHFIDLQERPASPGELKRFVGGYHAGWREAGHPGRGEVGVIVPPTWPADQLGPP